MISKIHFLATGEGNILIQWGCKMKQDFKMLSFFLTLCSISSMVAGKSLLANLMKQAETLQHGLDLASKVGDIGSHRNDIAFTAVPSSSQSSSSGAVIRFNTVKINHGNAFSTSNYRFTAPSAGLYVFSWSISVHSSYNGNSRLMKDGSIYHQTHCQRTYQQCGSTITIWLNKNNQVWVTSGVSSFYALGTYSSFSGWKIH